MNWNTVPLLNETAVVEALVDGCQVFDNEGDPWELGACREGEKRFVAAEGSDLTEKEVVYMLLRDSLATEYRLCARPKGMPRLSYSDEFAPFTLSGSKRGQRAS